MEQINGSVLNSMLLGRNHFCCLCFKTVADTAICTEDQVIVRKNDNTYDEVLMIDILRSILGSEINNQLSVFNFNAVCNKCSSEAINSYKFYIKCKENSQKLNHFIDSLINGTEIFTTTKKDTKGFKAGFLSINTENFECKGYKSSNTANTGSFAYQKFVRLQPKTELRKKPKKTVKTINTQCDDRRNEKNRILRLRLNHLNPRVIIKHSTFFVCPSCDKFFTRRDSKNSHYKRKHMSPVKSQKVIKTNEGGYLASSANLIETNDNYSIVKELSDGGPNCPLVNSPKVFLTNEGGNLASSADLIETKDNFTIIMKFEAEESTVE